MQYNSVPDMGRQWDCVPVGPSSSSSLQSDSHVPFVWVLRMGGCSSCSGETARSPMRELEFVSEPLKSAVWKTSSVYYCTTVTLAHNPQTHSPHLYLTPLTHTLTHTGPLFPLTVNHSPPTLLKSKFLFLITVVEVHPFSQSKFQRCWMRCLSCW